MKTRYIISSALMALATVGCTDLDVDIKSVYTEYPTDSEIAIEARISNAYFAFRDAIGRRYDKRLIGFCRHPDLHCEVRSLPCRGHLSSHHQS